jgi:hypothetical protein
MVEFRTHGRPGGALMSIVDRLIAVSDMDAVKVVTELTRAVVNEDVDRANRCILAALHRDDGDALLFHVLTTMFMSSAAFHGLEPNELAQSLHSEDGSLMVSVQALGDAYGNGGNQDLERAFVLWQSMRPKVRGAILSCLAFIVGDFYVKASGHSVNDECLTDPPCHPGGRMRPDTQAIIVSVNLN